MSNLDVERIREALAHHLSPRTDPCQDRGVDWPCDVADALISRGIYAQARTNDRPRSQPTQIHLQGVADEARKVMHHISHHYRREEIDFCPLDRALEVVFGPDYVTTYGLLDHPTCKGGD